MRGVRPLALAAWLIFMPALRYHDWPDRLTQLNAPTSSARCRAIGLPVQPQTDLLNPTILDVGDHPGQALPFGLITYIRVAAKLLRSEEHTSELQSRENLVCRLLLEKKKAKRVDTRVVR